MSLSNRKHWRQIICGLIIWVGPLWISQACLQQVDTHTLVKVLVQDSTGKPLPGFKLIVAGFPDGPLLLPGGNSSSGYQEDLVTTDQAGRFERNLHWHDKISYYGFFWTSNPSYPTFNGFYACTWPLTADCHLEYRRDLVQSPTAIILRAKLR